MKNDNSLIQVKILGIGVNPITVDELHAIIGMRIRNQQKSIIANVNVHALNLAYNNPWLREFLNNSPVVFCDGAGVMLGAKILGYSISERITYADWMWQLAAFASVQGFSFYFLGAKEGVSEKAARVLSDRFPMIKILGTNHGYFDKSPDSDENKKVLMKINTLKPDILVVGFGMPLQEHWLMENWGKIDATIALTGGAVFDYISGELRRGPKWLTDNGFEWLARLIIEPGRLWRRYIIGNPLFLFRILKQRIGLVRKNN